MTWFYPIDLLIGSPESKEYAKAHYDDIQRKLNRVTSLMNRIANEQDSIEKTIFIYSFINYIFKKTGFYKMDKEKFMKSMELFYDGEKIAQAERK